MDNTVYTFDDVLIKPKFSDITSRADVDLSTNIGDLKLRVPIISTNMDTITGPNMVKAMTKFGATGALHRFWSIEDYFNAFHETDRKCLVSIGLGEKEREVAAFLYDMDARIFVIDVANGAQQAVVDQTKWLYDTFDDITVIVSTFATVDTVDEFVKRLGFAPDFVTVNIGGGSVCKTRIQTGIGYPALSSVIEISQKYNTILNGGARNPGDIAKALAAGAKAVMVGNLFAGCEETPPVVANRKEHGDGYLGNIDFPYRGSASKESYEKQNKIASWRASEGVSTRVSYKGPVSGVLAEIEGGLRSSLTYTGSKNLEEFRKNAQFIRVSSNTVIENKPHKLIEGI